MDGLHIAILVVAVIFGIVGMVVQSQQQKSRLEALRALAGQLDWKFEAEGSDNDDQQLAAFHIGSLGRSKSVRNMMSGTLEGIAFKVFDFSYVISSGKNRRTVSQTVVEIAHAKNKRPRFFLRPSRAWWDRPLFESYRDFDFESHLQFSERYQLSGDYEQAVRTLFTPTVLEFIELQTQIFAECSGTSMVYYREDIEVKPELIRAFVDDAVSCCRILDQSAT